jgi:nicotinate dehydrogenase subunit A
LIAFKLNGAERNIDQPPDTPLLYVLRNQCELNGAKFGCGLGQCGSCTVLHNGKPIRSCVTPIGTLNGAEITTLEGLGTPEHPHPLQTAFVHEQAAQCGYCIPGMILEAKALLDRNPKPARHDVLKALDGHLCRCGTHNRIVRAVLRAAAGEKG